MKIFSCFVLVFGLCISNGLAFGFLFKRHAETDPPIPSVSSTSNTEVTDTPQPVTPKQPKNWFVGIDDTFRTMTNDFAKKAQQRMAQFEQSVFGTLQQEVNQFQPIVTGLQNKTAKEIRIMDGKIIETEEKIVSTGNKDEGTIAIYKIIKYRPQNPPTSPSPNDPQNENAQSKSNETVNASADKTIEQSQQETLENSDDQMKRINIKVDIPINNGDVAPKNITLKFSK